MKINKYIVLLTAMLLLQFSCKKFTDVGAPKTQLITTEAFKNDQSATAAVAGIYSKMLISGNFTSGSLTFYDGLSADELKINNSSSLDQDAAEYYNDDISTSSGILEGMWSSSYSIIAQSNICIEDLTSNASSGLTPSVKTQLLAESKFLRALMYFYLVNTFGDVPLVLNTDWEQSMKLGRASSGDVYNQIILDLSDAQATLAAEYVTGEKVRANKYAAIALLARVYLYQKQWSKAADMASMVINSNVYSLSAINDVFLANSDEAILQFEPLANTGINTVEGSVFIPSYGRQPTFAITQQLLNDFEPGDLRSSNWVNAYSNNGVSVYYPYKYKMGEKSTTLTEYVMVLRLAEMYLIRAEAMANSVQVELAIADLNTIRDRARDSSATSPLPVLNSNGMTADQVIAAVAHERRIELFCEWGHRWFDLKRTGKADETLKPIKSQYTTNSQLFPIPKQEILLSPQLVQNPGY